MRTSIKLIIVILSISYANDLLAQKFGLKAGYNLPFMIIEKSETALPYQPYSVTTEIKNGYHFGGTVELPVYKRIWNPGFQVLP